MLTEYTSNFISRKEELITLFREKLPKTYVDVVKTAIQYCVADPAEPLYDEPCYSNIQEISYGGYSGAKIYIISSETDRYFWAIHVQYGSCSACDTFKGISNSYLWYEDIERDEEDEKEYQERLDEAAKDYYTLALHCLQKMKVLYAEEM